MRGLKLVAALVLLLPHLGCGPRVSAEIVEPEPKPKPEPKGAEPVAASTLSSASAAVEREPERQAATAPPRVFPGFPGEPLRSEGFPDGLEIHDYTLGSGAAAQPGDRVSVHYVGELLDGTVFDSTHARATPFSVELGGGRMIPGMERGLEGVRVGMRRSLVIPPALAYGERALGSIPAHATLVFHVEVLSVEPPPPPPPSPHP